MGQVVNLAKAKATLSKLVDRAAAGEEITIAKAGKPLARLVPIAEAERRPFGIARHWKVPEDLFLEPTEVEELDAAAGKQTDDFGITRR
ncbi:MAG: type II toxin-antitoxin system prevent-host-death family antitoxin [Alphaproteobacteria bacterium]|nr:type II toxin-antitoxin system prevent-host-death family antitoxin [Alphaproteobacteria bacterium]